MHAGFKCISKTPLGRVDEISSPRRELLCRHRSIMVIVIRCLVAPQSFLNAPVSWKWQSSSLVSPSEPSQLKWECLWPRDRVAELNCNVMTILFPPNSPMETFFLIPCWTSNTPFTYLPTTQTHNRSSLPAFCFLWDILVFGVGDKLNHAWECRGRKEKRKKHICAMWRWWRQENIPVSYISFSAPSPTTAPSFDWPAGLWFSCGSKIVKTLHGSSV